MDDRKTLDTVYDPQAVEAEVYAAWEQAGAFRATPDGSPHERTFVIVIPLPNVTGALHLGHALNNTLQDILIRYHRMRGFNTLWQPGTDHAGIATQAVVERRIRELEGKSRHDLGREELVRRIWQWKDEYEKRIIGQLKMMGCSCDWERTRFTLDEICARAVRHQFFNLFKDGLIFRGKRLVNWDTELQTAVSNDEVYYETVKGHFWHFKYPVIDPKPGEPEHVIIATTRPETMLGDTAVAVHPDPEGFFEKEGAELRDGVAHAIGKEKAEFEAKLESLRGRRESHLARLSALRDMALDGRMLMLPLVEREIPLIADEWAKPLLGSGCVKITPAHDANDYDVGVRHDLPMINVLTADGKVARIIEPDGSTNQHSVDYEGLPFAAEGREKVLAELEARGLVHEIEDHDVEIGHSDRSKTPIEPYLSDQWFLRMGDANEPRASARADVPCVEGEPRASARADVPCLEGEPRALARAVRPTPDLSAGAILVTWTTYGTWLPGDERGFVSRVPRDDGSHELHNLPGERYDADDPQLRNSAVEHMAGEPVHLTPEQASVALGAIAGACERYGMETLAVAVMRDHVHVLCQTDRVGSELLQLLKGNASRELNKKLDLADSPRWWTKSGSTRFIKSRSDLTAAIEYVQNQKGALCMWSFDMESGDSVGVFESARAEARGSFSGSAESGESARAEARGSFSGSAESGESARAEARGSSGVRLGDGSIAPGLAQAAINAVQDGRIRIFPSRYTKSYLDWLGEKRDWCVGRQLWWGHRIPIWVWPVDGSPGLPDEVRARVEQCAERGMVTQQWLEDDQGNRRPCFCLPPEGDDELIPFLEGNGLERDEDVLDTWFSSALWPFSTQGWPDDTESLRQYYPGTVLVTSRDIITNWVARMVMFGLYAIGKIPFDHVYVHPKILDARGETMSKSKGNGVDPVDILHTHGADALRYTMADMTTETQDVRMPVEYVCPHCTKLIDQSIALKAEEQAHKSRGQKLVRRLQPADCLRVKCPHCLREFATQWADDDLKRELGVARETSDKFDMGRNFCNKLWNAARYALMNLEGAPCHPLEVAGLPPEDRWILARLSQTIRAYHRVVRKYQFSASIRELREFFWDSLCDWYLELTKPRMTGAPGAVQRSSAQQVLAFCIDQILRLLHPTMPFITERLWSHLNDAVPRRGFPGIAELTTDSQLIRAKFPPDDGYPVFDDEAICATFSDLQDATRGVRELRSQCGVSPKDKVKVTVGVPADHAAAFSVHAHVVKHMAGIEELVVDPGARRPKNAASAAAHGLRIYVHDITDDAAELGRTTKALASIERQIASTQGKLNNEKFLANARPEVVEGERERLADFLTQRTSLQDHLAELQA